MPRTHHLIALAPFALLAAACTAPATVQSIDTADPDTLQWVTPRVPGDPGDSNAPPVHAGEPFDLGVSTQAPDATVVHFVVDGTEVGTCDTRDPAQDCRSGDTWLWTFDIATPGHHVLEVWYQRADGSVVRVRREIDVLPAATGPGSPPSGSASEPDPVGDDDLVLDGEGDFNDSPGTADPALDDDDIDPEVPATAPDVMAGTPSTAPDTDVPDDPPETRPDPGYIDPTLPTHSIFGGASWSVQGHRVVFPGASLHGDTVAVAECVRAYGLSIRRYAEQSNVSRAAVVAAAMAATGCDGDAPRGVMGVRASTCAALTASDATPLTPAACVQRMHDSPDFAIQIGTRYLASPALMRQHHNDPPLMAATFATGTLAPSSRNRWHLLAPDDSTGRHDFITTFVASYNAYRTNEHVDALVSAHLPSDGAPLRPEGLVDPDGLVSSSQLDADAALTSSESEIQAAADQNLLDAATAAASHAPRLLRYHGGPVMNNAITVYVIWWGAGWQQNVGRMNTIRNFINGLDGSPWWRVNTQFADSGHRHVSPTVFYAGDVMVPTHPRRGHRFMRISENYIGRIVSHYVGPRLPRDSKSIYLVLTDDHTRMRGFCTSYCGWHTWETQAGTNLIYGFIGDAAVCPNACAWHYRNGGYYSPHNDAVDGTISVIAHELAEAATDPQINAWYEGHYNENGDKCAWQQGPRTDLGNGRFANVRLRGHNYLIQEIWTNAHGGRCVLHP